MAVEERPDEVDADSVPLVTAAILVPKGLVGVALKALNGMKPRWGALIARDSKHGASRKGVHIPDPRDDSFNALRALELPAPLDQILADACPAHAEGSPLAGDVPQELLDMLASGDARLDLDFQVPSDLDELHPCPEPDPRWNMSAAAPLEAQSADDHGGADGQAARICPGPGPFRFVELFAGIGGFRVALEALGGSCVFASELHPTAQAVYRENFPDEAASTLVGDIRVVPADDIPDHDLLTAGFPCQPFSALGGQDGLAVKRGQLFWHICRVLRARRPRAALLENVPGLIETDEGKAMDIILQELRASGYRVAYRILNSQLLVPQKRKRVYIVAIRGDLDEACAFFRFPWLPDLGRAASEIVEEPPAAEAGSLELSEERWLRMQQSRAFVERPEDVLGPMERPAAPLVSSYGQGRGAFIKCTQLVPGQGGRPPRRFSCRECARLQGFPEGFSYKACGGPASWYKLIGNAVSPPIVCALAGAIMCALRHAGAPCGLPGLAESLQLTLACLPKDRQAHLLDTEVFLPDGTRVAAASILSRAGFCTDQRPRGQRG